MRQQYSIWEFPEAAMNATGKRVDHNHVNADINTVRDAMRIFCTVTGWYARDLEPDTWDFEYEHVEFYHFEVGLVGGLAK